MPIVVCEWPLGGFGGVGTWAARKVCSDSLARSGWDTGGLRHGSGNRVRTSAQNTTRRRRPETLLDVGYDEYIQRGWGPTIGYCC